MIGDSRVRNLQKYDGLPVQKMLVRIPMLSEAEEVARYADVSLHSEMSVIRAVGQAAQKLGKIHGIILMEELDLIMMQS